MPDSSSSSTTADGTLTFIVAEGTPVNLRLLAASEPCWRWSSSSVANLAEATTAAEDAEEIIPGDADIWLDAGRSIIVEIKTAPAPA